MFQDMLFDLWKTVKYFFDISATEVRDLFIYFSFRVGVYSCKWAAIT